MSLTDLNHNKGIILFFFNRFVGVNKKNVKKIKKSLEKEQGRDYIVFNKTDLNHNKEIIGKLKLLGLGNPPPQRWGEGGEERRREL